MFIRFDMIHERDRRTDGHRMTAIAALMHSIVRQLLDDDDIKHARHHVGIIGWHCRTYRRASRPTAPKMRTIRPINRATHSTTAIAVPTTNTRRCHHHHHHHIDTQTLLKYVTMTVACMTSNHQNVTYHLIDCGTLQHILPHSVEQSVIRLL